MVERLKDFTIRITGEAVRGTSLAADHFNRGLNQTRVVFQATYTLPSSTEAIVTAWGDWATCYTDVENFSTYYPTLLFEVNVEDEKWVFQNGDEIK